MSIGFIPLDFYPANEKIGREVTYDMEDGQGYVDYIICEMPFYGVTSAQPFTCWDRHH